MQTYNQQPPVSVATEEVPAVVAQQSVLPMTVQQPVQVRKAVNVSATKGLGKYC